MNAKQPKACEHDMITLRNHAPLSSVNFVGQTISTSAEFQIFPGAHTTRMTRAFKSYRFSAWMSYPDALL